MTDLAIGKILQELRQDGLMDNTMDFLYQGERLRNEEVALFNEVNIPLQQEKTIHCYVNLDFPTEAFLQRNPYSSLTLIFWAGIWSLLAYITLHHFIKIQQGKHPPVYGRFFVFLFGLAFFSGGWFIGLQHIWPGWLEHRQAENWQPVTGKVLAARVVESDDNSDAEILYSYQVDGLTYYSIPFLFSSPTPRFLSRAA